MNLSELTEDLASVLNKHSAENSSNTPDYVLAGFLTSCLLSFEAAIDGRLKHSEGDDGLNQPATKEWCAQHLPRASMQVWEGDRFNIGEEFQITFYSDKDPILESIIDYDDVVVGVGVALWVCNPTIGDVKAAMYLARNRK